MTRELFEQATRLHQRLGDAAYQRLLVYAMLPYYDRRCETDPYVERVNRILGRSEQRCIRRAYALRRPQQ